MTVGLWVGWMAVQTAGMLAYLKVARLAAMWVDERAGKWVSKMVAPMVA